MTRIGFARIGGISLPKSSTALRRAARGRLRLLVVELDTPHPLVLSLNPVALKQVLAWCSVQRCGATLASTRQLEMP